MKVKKPNEITEEEFLGFQQFLKTTFAFSSVQLDAIAGETPMTYSIYKDCLNTCADVEDPLEFFRIMEQFPEFTKKFGKEIDEEIKRIMNKEETEEEKKWLIEADKRMRKFFNEKFGLNL